MVQRVGKEIFFRGESALLKTALYCFTIYCVDNDCIVATFGNGAPEFLVGSCLTCAHLHKARGNDNAFVAFADSKVLQYLEAHLCSLRVGVVCVIKHSYAVCDFHRQAVLHRLQTRNGVPLLVYRHTQVVGYGNGCKYVEQVARAQKTAVVLLVAKGKRYAAGTVNHIRCLVIAIAVNCVLYNPATACYTVVALYVFRIVVYHSQSVGRQRVDKLELGILYVFNALECLEVHFAHSGHNADRGVYKVAYLLDVVFLLCTHLHDEYLMIGTQMLAYCSYYAKQGVEVARGHKHVVFLGKYACKVVLCACLAETACHANYNESFVALDYALGVVVVMAVYGLFNGSIHNVGKQHYKVG